jgi:thioredoxin
MKKIGIFIILIFTFLITACGNKSEYLKDISYKDFINKQKNKENFILEVYRTGCHWCEEYKPVLEKLTKEKKLTIYVLNLANISDNEERELFEKYGSLGTPTIIFFEKGEEASKLKRSLGYKNESATISALQNAGYLQDK